MIIISVTSINMIYNAFSTSTTKWLKHLGMLANVRATEAQKCSSLLFEGLIAIPIGLLLGTVGMLITFRLINPIF